MTCWGVMPFTLVDKYQYPGVTCCLNIDSSFNLEVEAVVSSPSLVIIYQTAWCNLQEDHNLLLLSVTSPLCTMIKYIV